MQRPENIAHGDMPGDKVEIGEGHVQKANVIFKELLPMLEEASEKSETGKVVITVCGGSGVGKSEIASLLSFYLKEAGIGSYTLSGDNYPHRIPVYNDAERLHTFRESALKVMVLVNLKPAKLAGVLSEGMLLCAEDENGELSLMVPEKKMPSGAEIC